MSGHGQLDRERGTCGAGPSEGGRCADRPPRRSHGALPLATVGAGMLVRAVSVRAPDVVFVKGVVEASDGLASVFAERGGDLLLAAPHGREAELHELCADLERDIGARLGDAPGELRWDTDRQGA